MMRIVHLFTIAAALALAACGTPSDSVDPTAEADAFAQRINAPTPAAAAVPAVEATAAPRIAQPLPGAAPGPFVPGTQTDPAAATCGANRMGSFLGRLADEPTRLDIVKALGRSDNVRFVAFGSGGYINPDPTNPRLNLMLDAQGIIRDARCG
jgi:hypothetical protein